MKLFMLSKKGLMDDFTDLLSFVLILSMVGFFAAVVLRTDASDKTEQTLERIESFRGQQELLDLVNAPVWLDSKEVLMKDVIISTVNSDDETPFLEKMQEYFEQHKLEGGIAVYDAVSYGKEEKPEPLLSYHNAAFLGKEKGALYLTDPESIGNTKSIVVTLFG